MVDPTTMTTTTTTTEKDQHRQHKKRATCEAKDRNKEEEEEEETSFKKHTGAASSSTNATARSRDGNVGATNLPGRIHEEKEQEEDNYNVKGDSDVDSTNRSSAIQDNNDDDNNDNDNDNSTSAESGPAVAALNDQGKPKSFPSPSASIAAAAAAAEKARGSKDEVENEAESKKGDSGDNQPREKHSIEVLAEEVDGLRRRLDRFHQEQGGYFGHDGRPLVQQETAAVAASKTKPRMRELPMPPPPLPNVAPPGAVATAAATFSGTYPYAQQIPNIPPPTYASVVPLPQTAGILLRDPLTNNLPFLTPGMTNLHRHLRLPPAPLRTAQAGFFSTYPHTRRSGINSNYVNFASTPANSGSLSLLSSVSAAAAAAEAASTTANAAAMSATKSEAQLCKDPVGKVKSRVSTTDGCSLSRSPSLVQRGRVLTATSRGTSTDSEASISLLSLGALSRGSGGSSGTVSEERAQGILPTTKRKLPPQYQPESKTVILGKGNGPKVSPGNIRLKGIILDYVDEYSKGERREKIAIITKIIKEVRQVNTVAGFVKYEDSDGSWWEVSERDARVKVTAVFRDCLHENYRSSSSNKVRRRQEKRQQDKLKRKMKKPTTTNSSDDGNDSTNDDADDDGGGGVMKGS